MRCPIDETTLVMSDRNGIEIDYCPQCRGVWLDRGELDKIIDRSVGMPAPPVAPQAVPQQPGHQQSGHQQPGYQQYDDRRRHDDRRGDDKHYKKRKRESWLSELFD